VYLKERSFQIPRMIVDARRGGPGRSPSVARALGRFWNVVLPPFAVRAAGPNVRTAAFYAYDNQPRLLHGRRPCAHRPVGLGGEDPARRLNKQPGYAMRGGLSFDAALAAVTINPARMVGVDDRVGRSRSARTPTSSSGAERPSSPRRASSA
jgi:hypothetical protein